MTAWITFGSWFLDVLGGVLNLYFWIVVIAALMSWIEPNPYNPIVSFIYSITEPAFNFVREHLPVVFGGIDLSPLVVILAIGFLQRVVIPTLGCYAGFPGYPCFA